MPTGDPKNNFDFRGTSARLPRGSLSGPGSSGTSSAAASSSCSSCEKLQQSQVNATRHLNSLKHSQLLKMFLMKSYNNNSHTEMQLGISIPWNICNFWKLTWWTVATVTRKCNSTSQFLETLATSEKLNCEKMQQSQGNATRHLNPLKHSSISKNTNFDVLTPAVWQK